MLSGKKGEKICETDQLEHFFRENYSSPNQRTYESGKILWERARTTRPQI